MTVPSPRYKPLTPSARTTSLPTESAPRTPRGASGRAICLVFTTVRGKRAVVRPCFFFGGGGGWGVGVGGQKESKEVERKELPLLVRCCRRSPGHQFPALKPSSRPPRLPIKRTLNTAAPSMRNFFLSRCCQSTSGGATERRAAPPGSFIFFFGPKRNDFLKRETAEGDLFYSSHLHSFLSSHCRPRSLHARRCISSLNQRGSTRVCLLICRREREREKRARQRSSRRRQR